MEEKALKLFQQYWDDNIIELFMYAQNESSWAYAEHLNNKIIDYTLC